MALEMIDYADLMMKAERLRMQLGEDTHSPVDIFSLALGIEKLTIVFYPMGENISGMCIKDTEGRATIALNSSMSLGRQHFSLAHELFHLSYDDSRKSICAKTIGKGSEIERKADAFAAYFLMPRVAVVEKAESLLSKHSGKLTIEDVIRIEQFFGVSHQAAVYQLRTCGFIKKEDEEVFLNTAVRKKAEVMGFRSDLYCSSPESKQYCTYGHYIDQVNQLHKRALISEGKYEELLLDAFRDDIVYGFGADGGLID